MKKSVDEKGFTRFIFEIIVDKMPWDLLIGQAGKVCQAFIFRRDRLNILYLCPYEPKTPRGGQYETLL
jgi:hypothetical protein